MTLAQFGAVLLVIAACAVVHAEISVDCIWNDTITVKWTERQGKTGSPAAADILLGSCTPTMTAVGKGGAVETVFSAQPDACSFVRTITSDQITYSNELSWTYEAGTRNLYPVECVYPRPEDWSVPLFRPTWQLHASGNLLFHMALMDDDFSGPAQSSTFYLGSLIPILVAVDQQAHLPLLLLLDECVASTTPEPDPFGPVYPIITNGGCLMDSKVSRSRFNPRERTSELQLLVQAFRFALGANIYIHCTGSAWDPEALDEGKKACHYSKREGRWELLDDPSQNSVCSCCDSHCVHRKRRGVRSGLGGFTRKAVLGPLVNRDALGASRDASSEVSEHAWLLDGRVQSA